MLAFNLHSSCMRGKLQRLEAFEPPAPAGAGTSRHISPGTVPLQGLQHMLAPVSLERPAPACDGETSTTQEPGKRRARW